MSQQVIVSVEAPLLSPVQRVVNTFIAPSKTFEDVKRSSGWWVPFLIAAVIGICYGYVVVNRIGMPNLIDDAIRQSARSQDQMANATPEQAARIRSVTGAFIKEILYSGPIFALLIGLINAGVLLATANFGAGGRAKFSQILAVWFYSALPLTVFYLLVVAAIFGGVVGDTFHLKNPLGTNIGFFFLDGDLPKTLIPILSAFDLFAIWTAILLTIGVSTVAGIKRGAAAAVVFGWWFVFILLQVAGAAFG